MIEWGKMLKKEIKKICKFLLIGGSSTLIDFLIYFILSKNINVNLSKFISMVFSCTYSFLINKSWTFQVKGKIRFEYIIKYILTQSVNIVMNVATNRVILNITGEKLLAYVLATCVGMVCNFTLQRFFVFAKKGE